MSQEDFELAVREDAGILLKEDTRNKLIRKNAGLLEPLKEAILKSGLTIEQERLLWKIKRKFIHDFKKENSKGIL